MPVRVVDGLDLYLSLLARAYAATPSEGARTRQLAEGGLNLIDVRRRAVQGGPQHLDGPVVPVGERRAEAVPGVPAMFHVEPQRVRRAAVDDAMALAFGRATATA